MRPLLVILALLILAGCASKESLKTTTPQNFSRASYADVWDASLQVLLDHFAIAYQDKSGGTIRSQYRLSGTLFNWWESDASDFGELVEETLNQTRRMAIVMVKDTAEGPQVELQVYRERNTSLSFHVPRQAVQAVPDIQPKDSGAPIEYAPFIAPTELYIPPSSAWLPLGRDRAMEERLLQDIKRQTDRGKKKSPESQPPSL